MLPMTQGEVNGYDEYGYHINVALKVTFLIPDMG